MIDKFRKKIFWIIQILLTVMILTIITVYLFSNYTTAMKSISKRMNEYANEDIGLGTDNESQKHKVENSSVYIFKVKNNEIVVNENNADDETQKIAVKACNAKNDSGMIGKYMFKTKKIGNNIYSVTLVEDEEMQTYYIKNFIVSGALLICLNIIIFFVAKKISIMVVRPLEKFFEKQKQFISDASHELKTPISIIKINAQMEEKKLGKNKWNDYIQNETENMNKLVNDLLLLSKVENYENMQKYDKFNLSKEIEIVTSSFETVAYDKEVILKVKLDKNVNITGSKEDIKHILLTLVDNAIKHTEKNGKIVVELSKGKNEIILQVKNEGNPIPQDEREKIFERFYRIDKARNRSEKRYGLGLAIAKSIVEKYNGTIGVDCKNGITNFIVKLPIQN